MKEHAIHVSEPAYQLLLEQAARLNTTPEQLIERLLAADVAEALIDTASEPTGQAEALAAVQRLSTLFADVKVDILEQTLNDPMLELINVNLDEL
jgi:hypothetical protein